MKCLFKDIMIVFLGLAFAGIPGLQAQSRSNTSRPASADGSIVSLTGDLSVVMPDDISGWVYIDGFETDRFASESCIRSHLHSTGSAPSQPYLAYDGIAGINRRLVFVGYDAEPAVAAFCTPRDLVAPGRVLYGRVQVDVSAFSGGISGSTECFISYSSDARHWSTPQALSPGFQQIQVGPMIGAGYVCFMGRNVALDNLNLVLGMPIATHFVTGGSPIQSAIDQAESGDVIEVAPGTYSGNINLRGKGVILRSQGGPEVTRIQCDPGQRGIHVPDENGAAAVIEGFTITGGQVGQTGQPMGGGILCENSNPLIVNCQIVQCSAQTGAGIASMGGNPAISSCLLEGNTASEQGGGIALIQSSRALLENTTLIDNNARLGAGLSVQSHSFMADAGDAAITVRGCVFAFNGASQFVEGGAGVYGTGTYLRLHLENCILSRNSSARGAALLAESVGGFSDDFWHMELTNCTIADNLSTQSCLQVNRGRTRVKNCIVWGNQGTAIQMPFGQHAVNYSTVQDGYEGLGNLSMPPRFYDPVGSSNRIPDYRLQGDSPCIDAGDFYNPVGSEPSPHGNRINMGAFGGTTQATGGGRTLHVDINSGSDFGTNGSTRTRSFQHIQRAIDNAQQGDAVLIWPGVYLESVSIPDLHVTVQGVTDPPVVSGGTHAAFSLVGQHGPETLLRNMIITASYRAVFCSYAFPTIANLTIVQNEGGIESQPPEPDISSCIFWDNAWDLWGCSASFSCIQNLDDPSKAPGSFAANPLFSNGDIGDFHLQSRGGRYDIESGKWVNDFQSSPCIDSGDPSYFSGSESSPHGGTINIGAYGGTPYASRSPLGFGTDAADTGLAAMIWLDFLPLTASVHDLNSAIYLNSILKEGVSKAGSGGIIGR
jgi:parallel beta-helix repeat protein